MNLRAAHADEALALAKLHVDVWRNTYADLATPEALATLDAKRRLPLWQGYLADPAHHIFVASQNGTLTGVVCLGPPSHPAFGQRGEIDHLYVAKSAARQGIGKQLLNAALAHLAKGGYQGAALAVVRQNHPARAFYAACGGKEAGEFIDSGPLWKSENIVMAWDWVT